MLPLRLPIPDGRPLRLLAIGAHSDDLELGCGATILMLGAAHALSVDWVVLAATDEREGEAAASAAAFLPDAELRVRVERFRDGFLPHSGPAVKEVFETLKVAQPDLILTTHLADAHQDHRLVAELTWNTFRDHTILSYEIPKYDGDLTTPNLYVPVTEEAVAKKVDLLLSGFPSQRHRSWFDPDLFRSVLRLRGMECNAPSGYAEGFHARKLTFGV